MKNWVLLRAVNEKSKQTKYKAIKNNVKDIKIIHGKNGGILRKAVHDYLKHNKHVETFRLGNYYEGSYGVTIIKLKQYWKVI